MLGKKRRSEKSALDELPVETKRWAVRIDLLPEELNLRHDEFIDLRYDPVMHSYSLLVFTYERRPIRLIHAIDRLALKLQRTAREELERELHPRGS